MSKKLVVHPAVRAADYAPSLRKSAAKGLGVFLVPFAHVPANVERKGNADHVKNGKEKWNGSVGEFNNAKIDISNPEAAAKGERYEAGNCGCRCYEKKNGHRISPRQNPNAVNPCFKNIHVTSFEGCVGGLGRRLRGGRAILHHFSHAFRNHQEIFHSDTRRLSPGDVA